VFEEIEGRTHPSKIASKEIADQAFSLKLLMAQEQKSDTHRHDAKKERICEKRWEGSIMWVRTRHALCCRRTYQIRGERTVCLGSQLYLADIDDALDRDARTLSAEK